MYRFIAISCLLVFTSFCWATIPCRASGEPESSVVDAVLSMLEAGIAEEVIIEWLEGANESIDRPQAEQLIALQEAGASSDLLKWLLAAAAEPSSKTLEQPTPTDEYKNNSAASEPAPSTTGSAAEVGADQLTESGPEGASEIDRARKVMLNFDLSYSPWYLAEDDYDLLEDSWDFFVYMNGIPISYVPAATVSGMTSNLEFSQLVDPGGHLVRVTLERHWRGPGDRWSHAAIVARESFPIEISAHGPEATLKVRFKENWGRLGDGPLDFTFSQGEQVVELEGVGGSPEEWPALCEEIEANLESGQRKGAESRRGLENCVRWSDLWPGRWAPPRDEVREALAMFEFRPVPKGS